MIYFLEASCDLKCMSTKNNLVTKLFGHAVDGTECTVSNIPGRCVRGECNVSQMEIVWNTPYTSCCYFMLIFTKINFHEFCNILSIFANICLSENCRNMSIRENKSSRNLWKNNFILFASLVFLSIFSILYLIKKYCDISKFN